MKKEYQMSPDDLQALREQADIVGLHDVEAGKLFKLLLPHVAHLHGLDPEEEDQRIEAEQQKRHDAHRKAQEKAIGHASLTPAQEESKRQAKAQGEKYVPEEGDTLDPVAREAQKRGALVVPTAQEEEALASEPPANTLPISDSTYPDFSSSESAPERSHRHGGHKEK